MRVRWSCRALRFALKRSVSSSAGSLTASCRAAKISSAVDFETEPLGTLPREQREDEVGAIRGQLEERLVHQVQLQVAAPDVDDEDDLRLERGDVREVLLGPDAEVDALDLRAAGELRDDVLEVNLVRKKIVGAELAVGFGEVGDERPVVAVGELLRQRRRAGADGMPRHPGEGQREDRGDEQERAASRHASTPECRDYDTGHPTVDSRSLTVDCLTSSPVSARPRARCRRPRRPRSQSGTRPGPLSRAGARARRDRRLTGAAKGAAQPCPCPTG